MLVVGGGGEEANLLFSLSYHFEVSLDHVHSSSPSSGPPSQDSPDEGDISGGRANTQQGGKKHLGEGREEECLKQVSSV